MIVNASDDAPLDAARALLEQGARRVLMCDSGRAPHATDDAPRWSLLFHDPVCVLTEREGRFFELDASGAVRREVTHPVTWLLEQGAPAPDASQVYDADGDLVPFTSGIAGFLGFSFCHQLDDPRPQRPPLSARTPQLWVGRYERVTLFKHAPLVRAERAGPARSAASGPPPRVEMVGLPGPLAADRSRAAAEHYRQRVRACIEAIVARGDLFEINYTERFAAPVRGGALEFYERLRGVATGEFFGLLHADDFQLASISPEQFLKCSQGRILTRPIKGSRRRHPDPAQDRALAEALLSSEKDRAENVMIVDLMRNDLTRVCRLGTVRTTSLCALESFAGIHHLVSTIEGELAPECSPIEALLSCFPAGSITGAPKLSAIEHAFDLEASARGAYTGTLFYASAHGELDSSVLIRTAELVDDMAWYGAGGAVVADSDPQQEWEEALLKARPFFVALEREEP